MTTNYAELPATRMSTQTNRPTRSQAFDDHARTQPAPCWRYPMMTVGVLLVPLIMLLLFGYVFGDVECGHRSGYLRHPASTSVPHSGHPAPCPGGWQLGDLRCDRLGHAGRHHRALPDDVDLPAVDPVRACDRRVGPEPGGDYLADRRSRCRSGFGPRQVLSIGWRRSG